MISHLFTLLRAVNVEFKLPCLSNMKFICLTLLIISGITDSRSEEYDVVGPEDAVLAVAGEDVILPCSLKPNTSVVDMRVEWFRPGLKDSLVHLYEDHEDRNTDQIQSYRGRTELIHQELQRGNASLKLSSVRASDEGYYKCFIQSKSWYDDVTVDVRVEAVGRPPLITVDGFDHSERLHLQCESEGWYPEPYLEWLNSEGVSLTSETTETQKNTDRFTVKHTITVHHSVGKILCRVRLKHHMLETQIVTSSKSFNPWRTSVILSLIAVALIVIAGMLIAAVVCKNRELDNYGMSTVDRKQELDQLKNENMTNQKECKVLQNKISRTQQECKKLQNEIKEIQQERNELLKNENMKIKEELHQQEKFRKQEELEKIRKQKELEKIRKQQELEKIRQQQELEKIRHQEELERIRKQNGGNCLLQ
ncbi:butyrophilin-like protein 3 isoform X3 [Labeo rohita]|uniref:butyrophilin-like protein 3 isoform X2 n=1 Tax=Labeo rohita TaxID=84645 RepID=UPI0021E3437D|nr:butyrophilin-like protein 3 isoform X2 [Labeo rohita]XP_050959693.1 butyrophilin-like protein 3 isoform X3 [Labeo rohita]